jgi:hypothetical protein
LNLVAFGGIKQDVVTLRHGKLDDGTMRFSRALALT